MMARLHHLAAWIVLGVAVLGCSRHQDRQDLPAPRASEKDTAEGKPPRVEDRLEKLKKIGLAMHLYEHERDSFPPRVVRSDDGRPLLSWRVLLLPYLGEEKLFGQFHLDEPWDSQHNRPLVEQTPEAYLAPGQTNDGRTRYMVFDDERAVCGAKKRDRVRGVENDERGPTFRELRPSNLAQTCLAVEAGPDKAVPWTKPEDLPFVEDDPAAALGQLSDAGIPVLFADGSAHMITKDVDPASLLGLITYRGGEQMGVNELIAISEKGPKEELPVLVGKGVPEDVKPWYLAYAPPDCGLAVVLRPGQMRRSSALQSPAAEPLDARVLGYSRPPTSPGLLNALASSHPERLAEIGALLPEVEEQIEMRRLLPTDRLLFFSESPSRVEEQILHDGLLLKRFVKPLDIRKLLSYLEQGAALKVAVEPKTDTKFYQVGEYGGWHFADHRSVLRGALEDLRAALQPHDPATGAVTRRLQDLDQGHDLIVVGMAKKIARFAEDLFLVSPEGARYESGPEWLGDINAIVSQLTIACLRIDLDGEFPLEAILDAKDDEALATGGQLLRNGLQRIKTAYPGFRREALEDPYVTTDTLLAIEFADRFLDEVEILRQDNELIVRFPAKDQWPTFLRLFALRETPVREEAPAYLPRLKNVADIGRAMLWYSDLCRCLPPKAYRDRQGRPLLSWRVLLLLHLGENELYHQFHLEEPWDSDHNLKLLV